MDAGNNNIILFKEQVMSKPVKTIRVCNVQMAIWENKNGEFVTQSVTFSKSYQDKDKNWKNTSSFNYLELHYIKMAIDEALRDKYVKGDPDEKF